MLPQSHVRMSPVITMQKSPKITLQIGTEITHLINIEITVQVGLQTIMKSNVQITLRSMVGFPSPCCGVAEDGGGARGKSLLPKSLLAAMENWCLPPWLRLARLEVATAIYGNVVVGGYEV